MQYDDKVFKLCYLAEKIYPGESTPIEIFNNHLADRPFAETVRIFTGALPQLKSLEQKDLLLYSQSLCLMEKLREKTIEIFESSECFCSDADVAAQWVKQTYNSSGEKTLSNVFYKITNNRNLFKDMTSIDCAKELLDLFVELDGESAGIINSREKHFFTNNDYGKQAADDLLSGKVFVFDSVADSTKECLSMNRGELRIKSGTKKFIITRSRLVELLKSKGF